MVRFENSQVNIKNLSGVENVKKVEIIRSFLNFKLKLTQTRDF